MIYLKPIKVYRFFTASVFFSAFKHVWTFFLRFWYTPHNFTLLWPRHWLKHYPCGFRPKSFICSLSTLLSIRFPFSVSLYSRQWRRVSRDEKYLTGSLGSFSHVSCMACAKLCITSCLCVSFGCRQGRNDGDCILYKVHYKRRNGSPLYSPGFVIYDWAWAVNERQFNVKTQSIYKTVKGFVVLSRQFSTCNSVIK